MIKIKNRTYDLLYSIIVPLLTTAVISFTLVFKNNLGNFSILIWIKTWMLVFIMVYILSLFLPKLIRKLMLRILKVR